MGDNAGVTVGDAAASAVTPGGVAVREVGGRPGGRGVFADGEAIGRERGNLRSVVVAGEGAGAVLGEVVWIATERGWFSARRGSAPPQAVQPAELASWLAPMLATALAAGR